MSGQVKDRCSRCGCIYALRKNGLLTNHRRYTYEPCNGGGLLPLNPTTIPTWEARALDAEQRADHAEATLRRIQSIPVKRGGVINASDLERAFDYTPGRTSQ